MYTIFDNVPECASFLESLSEDMKGKTRHPAAEKYWLDYRSTRSDLAWDIFHLFGDSVSGYKLNAKYTRIHFDSDMGEDASFHEFCLNGDRSIRCARIILSTQHVDNPERMRDCMLHELCHVAVWQIHGQTDEKLHGPKWKWFVERLEHIYPYINIEQTCSESEYTHLDNVPGCASFLESLSEGMNGKKRHPVAQEYFQDYRSKRFYLAWDIFEVFNSSVSNYKLDPSKMAIYFNDQLWTGVGRHKRGIDNSNRKISVIYLSIRSLDNPERLRDTLLHELCHATVYQIDEIREEDPHGPKWEWWIQQVGYKHPNISKLTVFCDDERNEYLYKCSKCGRDIGAKQSLPKYLKKCVKCNGRLRFVELHDPELLNPPHLSHKPSGNC